jgi:RND family efflux transporter MFP subunit
MKKAIIALVIIVVALAAFTALSAKRSQKKIVPTQAQIRATAGLPVSVGAITKGDVEDITAVTGDIAALTSVSLASKTTSRVIDVAVREGDAVSAGQALIRLDPSDATSQVNAAEAGLLAARARLSQAQTAAASQETQSSAAIAQAKSGLDIAQSHLAVVKQGARTQERLVAQNAVDSAKANLANASSNYKRYKGLAEQGAISAQQLDTYKTQNDVAKAQYDSAVQQLSLIKEGARPEDIEAAESQVKQAREGLRTAKANASQVAIRREDIKNARAGVAQAQAALAKERSAYDDTLLRTTTSGIVSYRAVEPGQTAQFGSTLMTVVNLGTVYFQANVSERVIDKIKVNQPVSVSVDALRGKQFVGRISKIFPVASTASRNFMVRILVPNPGKDLRPGMFARGDIAVGVHNNKLLAPNDAIDERHGDNFVFVLEGKTVKMVPVQIGVTGLNATEILEPTSLKPGDRVVMAGRQGLQDKSKVYVTE